METIFGNGIIGNINIDHLWNTYGIKISTRRMVNMNTPNINTIHPKIRSGLIVNMT